MTIDPTASVWQGKLVRLRAVEPADWETYFEWNRDDEQARALYLVPFPQSREAVKRFAETEATRERKDDNVRFAIENGDGVYGMTVDEFRERYPRETAP